MPRTSATGKNECGHYRDREWRPPEPDSNQRHWRCGPKRANRMGQPDRQGANAVSDMVGREVPEKRNVAQKHAIAGQLTAGKNDSDTDDSTDP
ncbi:MAG: hypothetical protein KDA32_03050 [Phycisphaerales bacterium]|nr:hypothetical protein [Phycisphaerales bacterium]